MGGIEVLTRVVHLRRHRAIAHQEPERVYGPEMLGALAGAFLCFADPLTNPTAGQTRQSAMGQRL